jgi:uncharacterized membrane protein
VNSGRLEAFSDGVIAIIITILVLELKIPQGTDFAALEPLGPVFMSHILSFVYLGIYWNNHHHMLHATERVDGRVLWANLHLLFWLSLIPFVTGWMGENRFATIPVALYGAVLCITAVAYYILAHTLLMLHEKGSALANALSGDFKGKVSVVIYAGAIPLAFFNTWLAFGLYAVVAALWFIPDRRIEREVVPQNDTEAARA